MSLIGLVTRSALASLLGALVFWGTVSIVQFAANQMEKTQAEVNYSVEQADQRIAEIRERAALAGRALSASEQSRIDEFNRSSESMKTIVQSIEPWMGTVQRVELLVPKTGDVQKIVAEQVQAPTFAELMLRLQGFDPDAMAQFAGMDREQFRDAQQAGAVGERAVREVNAWRSIGSSLGFAAVVLALSLWIFARRDF
jgi:hypothetical protein